MGTSVTIAWVTSIIIMIVLFLIATCIANAINYEPRGGDETKRKIWFWVLAVLTPVVSFLSNLAIASGIEVPSAKDDYIMQSGISCVVAFVLFILIGLIVSKIFSNKKVSSWF